MNPTGYAFLGLTAMVGVLVAILAFAVLRFAAAARDARKGLGDGRMESALLSSALEDAIAKLKAQERATAARAEASERLSDEIISSLTSGLLVVGLDATVRIMNPAARRLLGLPDTPVTGDYHSVIDEPALSQTIDECLASGRAVLRR